MKEAFGHELSNKGAEHVPVDFCPSSPQLRLVQAMRELPTSNSFGSCEDLTQEEAAFLAMGAIERSLPGVMR